MKLETPIFAISGKAHSGKDTVARDIGKRLKDFRIIPLAKKLKEVAADLWSLDFERLLNDPPYKKKYRKLLIDFGCKMREIDKDVWVRHVLREASYSDTPVLVPDVRFPNELQCLGDAAKLVYPVRVNATEETRKGRMGRLAWNDYPADDISETALDNSSFSHIINNDFKEESNLQQVVDTWVDDNVLQSFLEGNDD